MASQAFYGLGIVHKDLINEALQQGEQPYEETIRKMVGMSYFVADLMLEESKKKDA